MAEVNAAIRGLRGSRMPFKSIGIILFAGFLLGFGAVPVAQALHEDPPPEYSPVTARMDSTSVR